MMSNTTQEASVTTPPKFVTRILPTPAPDVPEDESSGPSWGLIIPIIMIGLFLITVGLCLWWHKWRDKRTLQLHRSGMGSSFQRSYRHSRTNRSYVDAIRDSTRSTAPLRSSVNEKIGNNNNMIKISNVNVTPVQATRNTGGKFAFHWDKNHWKAYGPAPTPFTNLSRSGTKPLSPIDEIDSPASMQPSERSHTRYDVSAAQANFRPYTNGYYTPTNPANPYARPEIYHQPHQQRYPTKVTRVPDGCSADTTPTAFRGYEPATVNSPFFPNNNTPTTECDTESNGSHIQLSSQFTSYPSSPRSQHNMDSNFGLSLSTETDTTCRTSYNTTHSQETFHTSTDLSRSGLAPSSAYPSSTFPASGETSHTHPSTNYSSLPSSIAPFGKQNQIEDSNNNSVMVPSAYASYPALPYKKGLDYTLASSVDSTDTCVTENTSLQPNVGSSNTSSYPAYVTSRPQSMEPSGHASPEDLSKLVDEMSSIRPVEETSLRPNSTLDPVSKIMTISVGNVTPDLHKSWSVLMERDMRASLGSVNTSSQNGSMYWDNYPLNLMGDEQRSFQETSLHDSLVQHLNEYGYRQPVLMETQYWV